MSMSERLQVIIENKEYSIVRNAAAKEGQTISEWVRALIRDRLAKRSSKNDLDVLQVFQSLQLPSPPIEQMLKEIEEGRS